MFSVPPWFLSSSRERGYGIRRDRENASRPRPPLAARAPSSPRAYNGSGRTGPGVPRKLKGEHERSTKRAAPDHPIHEFLVRRWSPYAFADRPVSDEDLCALFEAARWAPSSYNEQPWSYIVATRANPDEFDRLLSCLIEANQAWAKSAPVLALGCISLNFRLNNKPNAVAVHDLGLASGSLVLEATARGLFVHQMAGHPAHASPRDLLDPEGIEPKTGLAIGYLGRLGCDCRSV